MSESTRISGVRIASFAHIHGKAKTPPHKPYDMRRVYYLVPARDAKSIGESSEYNRVAFGFEVKEAECLPDDALLEKFRELVFLEPCDIYVAPHPDDLTKNVIVDVEQKVHLVASPMTTPAGTADSQPAPKGKF